MSRRRRRLDVGYLAQWVALVAGAGVVGTVAYRTLIHRTGWRGWL
jgi:hypothetical protein